MERNSETKTLSFSKGMTNVPSDLLSDDNELQESIGFIYKDGEMKPIQKPVSIGDIPYKIMYVHKMADYKNIIAYDGTDKIYSYRVTDGTIGEEFGEFSVGILYDVKSVGNTLVCATENGPYYLLYKAGNYLDLGTDLPEYSVSFCFKDVDSKDINLTESDRNITNLEEIVENKKSDKKAWYDESGNFIGLYEDKPENGDYSHDYYYFSSPVSNENEILFQEAVQGQVAEGISWVKKNNLFAFPFFVRTALVLYDGSYAKISNPIICYPTVRYNRFIAPGYMYLNSDKKYTVLGSIIDARYLFYDIKYKQMYFEISGDEITENWKDVVKEIRVFATDQVLPFKIDGKWKIVGPEENFSFLDYLDVNGEYKVLNCDFKKATNYGKRVEDGIEARVCVIPDSDKTDDEIINELLSKSQFYKLFTLSLSDKDLMTGLHPTISDSSEDLHLLRDGVVENLTEQEQLDKDDYYGWSKAVFQTMFVYNKRLNFFNFKRFPYRGFPIQSSATNTNAGICFTHIKSNYVDTWVYNVLMGSAYTIGGWFYYPDPNATEINVLFSGNVVNIKLKQHPYLNGAFCFKELPGGSTKTNWEKWDDKFYEEMPTGGYETFDSQIYTSVVNNPFVFEASGDNTIGTGKILGIAANTEAVSQGQFGQYPLMVFTDEGVYGMSVNSEGLYSSIYPISREVANEDTPFVSTDTLVFFASKKGLMAASGGSVVCMSGQMRGRTPENFITLGEGRFIDFLKDCLIAYDYRDSMLRIFSKDKSYQYIYNTADKTFSMINSGITAQAVVNDYPDNLIQDTEGHVYSLLEKPDINEDENTYDGTIVTRPLKLGGSLTLKSLRKIKHLVNSSQGNLKLEIWASNNTKSWCQLHSLGGKPWSYFVFKYKLANFKANDSFTGTIVRIQNRREIRF